MEAKVSSFSMLRVNTDVDQAELDLPDDCVVKRLKNIILRKYPHFRLGME